MLVSFTHRFTFLAMPKCASTALETALGPRMELQVGATPADKHMNLRRYDRQYRRWLEDIAAAPMETVCLFREPVDWLFSWWRYRGRPGIPDKSKSTAQLSFETFVDHYLDHGTGPSRIGRQSRFVSRPDGQVGVDHLFRYDDIDGLLGWIGERTGWLIAPDRVNISPAPHQAAALSPALRRRLEDELSADFRVYETIGRRPG